MQFTRSIFHVRGAIASALAIGAVASCVLFLGTDSNGADDDLDPRSVEWVCTQAPERVRALFDSLNLERPGLEDVKRAVGAGDYPTACNALLSYYQDAKTAPWLRRPFVSDSGQSNPRADPILADEFEFYGDRGKVPRTPSGRIQWSYNGPKNDPQWGGSLNKMDYFAILMSAYLRTGGTAYVERIDQDTRDWILSNPRPDHVMKQGPWHGIDTATRPRNWLPAFYGLQEAPAFSPAARILMLSSLLDHAHYLMLFHTRASNNQTVSEVSTLGIIGCAWPEFRDAVGWRAYAQEHIGQLTDTLVYPDGAEAELTSHYQRISTETFDKFIETYRQFGYAVADSVVVDVRRMWTYLAYTLRPDGTAPENNDSDRRDLRGKLKAAAKVHDRPDWEFIASNGKEGLRPRIGPTVTFPWAGHTVMRNGWDADAQWAFFDAGPFGVAHQHHDKLHISIDAFGRALLVDAGRYNYERGPFRDYFVGSASHNVLLIDGAGQKRTSDRAERPVPGGDYGTNADFDYARGIFDAGFEGVGGRVVHTRTVVYVRNQFWIVADRIETDRARKVDALWHFAPDCHVVIEGKTAASTDAEKGNLRIAPVGGVPWKVSVVAGAEKPIQGWYSRHYTEKEPNPTVIFSAEIPGTTTFAWVLVPAPGATPPVEAHVLSSREDRIELRVQTGTEKAFVVVVPMNSWRPSVRREG